MKDPLYLPNVCVRKREKSLLKGTLALDFDLWIFIKSAHLFTGFNFETKKIIFFIVGGKQRKARYFWSRPVKINKISCESSTFSCNLDPPPLI
jgi:hypothetical protein